LKACELVTEVCRQKCRSCRKRDDKVMWKRTFVWKGAHFYWSNYTFWLIKAKQFLLKNLNNAFIQILRHI
jgi:hypothetical protein